jgi:hypothetical protein
MNDDANFDHLLSNPLIIIYGVISMIWITLFHESWKRKQNYIANEWLVRDFKDATAERPEFQCESTIDPETQLYWKVASKDAYVRQMIIGVPVSLAFMGLVVMAQVALQYTNWELGSSNDDSD